jgi:hypothetical protein
MIERRSVGVKLPETGVGAAVGEEEIDAVGVALAVDVGVGEEVPLGVAVPVAVGVGVKEAEGVASKAGPSAASTIKVRVRVLNMPLMSRQEMVIL